jgi:signal-transduction protein with cAMP-binding, CBS, and nucleotidyltransferase domain
MTTMLWTRINEVVHRDPVIVAPHLPLREVAAVMNAQAIGAVIVGTTKRAAGILSERDIVRALGLGADPDTATAAGAMSSDVVSVRPTDAVYDAAVDMLDLGIRHVPVLDERGTVLGMVSVRDLLRPLLLGALERVSEGS